jgi:taurine dioxygenase
MEKMTASLKATELMPGLGVKVELDLARPPSDEIREELRRLFNTHHLLFIEAPDLSSAAQLDLFETLGKAIPATTDGKVEMIVSNARSDGYLGNYELEWHCDGSFVPEPFIANCLYAMDVAERKSATRFVSAAAGYARLPQKLKDAVAYLQVFNTNEIKVERGRRVATLGADLAGAAHRLVSRHPVTGVPYIAANAYQTDCVIGLDPDGSRALLREIYLYLYAPDHVYEHWWRNGDLVIWDNMLVQHSRGDMSDVGTRTLRRFTIGTALVADQLPARQRELMEASFRARVGQDARRRPDLQARQLAAVDK